MDPQNGERAVTTQKRHYDLPKRSQSGRAAVETVATTDAAGNTVVSTVTMPDGQYYYTTFTYRQTTYFDAVGSGLAWRSTATTAKPTVLSVFASNSDDAQGLLTSLETSVQANASPTTSSQEPWVTTFTYPQIYVYETQSGERQIPISTTVAYKTTILSVDAVNSVNAKYMLAPIESSIVQAATPVTTNVGSKPGAHAPIQGSSADGSLSGNPKIGIGLGVAFGGVLVVGALAFFFFVRPTKRRRSETLSDAYWRLPEAREVTSKAEVDGNGKTEASRRIEELEGKNTAGLELATRNYKNCWKLSFYYST